jgi:hypothetical protein
MGNLPEYHQVTQTQVSMEYTHGAGPAAYCKLESKVSLGFVEGLNNTEIRVPQRRPGSLRNEAHPRLQVRPGMLPRLQKRSIFTHKDPHFN